MSFLLPFEIFCIASQKYYNEHVFMFAWDNLDIIDKHMEVIKSLDETYKKRFFKFANSCYKKCKLEFPLTSVSENEIIDSLSKDDKLLFAILIQYYICS
jgi:hypothetical protein